MSSFQRCIFCDKHQATIRCRMKTCNRRFHYKCGFDSEKCLFKFDDLFYAFCPAHSAKPRTSPPSAEDSCVICLTEPGPFTPFGVISLNCRPYMWMHRKCAIQLAASRGYAFQCPICAETKVFQKYVCLRGVFIPQRDTLTQAHNVAYQETQTKYCEAEICLRCSTSVDMRDPRADEKLLVAEAVAIVKCGYCGKVFHEECGLKQGVTKDRDKTAGDNEDGEKSNFTCSSCMNLSDHELSVSSVDDESANELNAGFDFGSDCSSLAVVEPMKAITEETNTADVVDEEEEEGSEAQLVKRFRFEHQYEWRPCRGYHNKDWRQFKLNLFMNTLRCGVKRKGGAEE